MAERILVVGVGNIFQSDDGFGCEVARVLLDRELPPEVTVVDYGIRSVHLAFDLTPEIATMVIVDTVPEVSGGPGSLVVLDVDPSAEVADPSFDAHSMDPGSMLRSLAALASHQPQTFVVGCQPETLDDGIGLSPAVSAAVPAAADTVVDLVASIRARATREPLPHPGRSG